MIFSTESTDKCTGSAATDGAGLNNRTSEQKLASWDLMLYEEHKNRRDWLPAALAAITFLTLQNGQALASSISTFPSMSVGAVVREHPEWTAPIEQTLGKLSLTCPHGLLTGIVDPISRTASLYYTLELKNTSSTDREAEADIILPDGAVVSRATLWVNGVPQEAAFNSLQRTTEAYNWITQKHRDPLLVTYKDERTIHLRAFPVPAGGKMKLRLGITSPLQSGEGLKERITLPYIGEANFALGSNEVSVKTYEIAEDGGFEKGGRANHTLLSRSLSNDELSSALVSTEVGNLPFAVRALHSPGNSIVVQEGGEEEGLSLTRTAAPSCKYLDSESAAARISALWARNEVMRLLRDGQKDRAEELCEVYRIVTPVSGAIVMELDSDYTYQGLNRNFYMTDHTASNNRSRIPVLQGATNGSIGPQSNAAILQGATNDGLVISGVNTAGTVRVGSAGLSSWTDFIDLAFILSGLLFLFKGLTSLFSAGIRPAFIDLFKGLTMIYFSAAWLIALPVLGLIRYCKKVKLSKNN